MEKHHFSGVHGVIQTYAGFKKTRAEIHQAILSQFSLLVEFLIRKGTVKD